MTNYTDIKTYWEAIMDETKNPLKYYSLPTAHMIMQSLAWMWSAIFSIAVGSYYLFGALVVGHMLVIVGLVVTLMVFQKAEADKSEWES